MSTKSRVASVTGALLLVLAMLVSSTGHSYAQSSPGCDTTGTVNGTATPTYGALGARILLRGTGFQANEDVSFYFTLPNGSVVGTAAPIPGGVNPDGSVGPLTLSVTQQLLDLGTGRWAVTFVGASSHVTAVVYFCILTTAQATAVAQPSNTAVPATATTVPATGTTVSATATTLATAVSTVLADTPTTLSGTATGVATTAATATTVPASSPTSLPPTSIPATSVPATTVAATEVTQPTAPEASPTAMTSGGNMGGTTPGMPRTGSSDSIFLLAGLFLLALGAAGAGFKLRQIKSNME
ncbi:MAG: LPXTG cell wall anchor domain-containing protein [Chloroflexota bacterium]|nr:LPXTG cell wall anchor domain-containing protein [Chloroflexota bacterium]